MGLIELDIPLRDEFSNARGSLRNRRIVLVSVTESGFTGWGEAAPYPGVTTETATDVRKALESLGGPIQDPGLQDLPPTAFAALDQALADLEAKRAALPLWEFLGGVKRPIRACAAIGLSGTPSDTVERVNRAVEAGVLEVKVKIRPGHDLEYLRAVRGRFPDLAIAADANGSYRPDDPFFGAVDSLALIYLEQPLSTQDLGGHSQLRDRIETPVCLDESAATSHGAIQVIERGCADIVSVKPGLLGVHGIRRIAEQAKAAGIDLKVGGLMETSVGRAHALALATLAPVRFTDLVPPRRLLSYDVSRYRWNLDSGHHPLPEGPGLGIRVGPFPGAGSGQVVRSEWLDT